MRRDDIDGETRAGKELASAPFDDDIDLSMLELA